MLHTTSRSYIVDIDLSPIVVTRSEVLDRSVFLVDGEVSEISELRATKCPHRGMCFLACTY